MSRLNCCASVPPASRSGSIVRNALLALLFLTGVASADRIDATAMDWSRAMPISIWEDGNVVNGAYAGVIFITLSSNGRYFYRDTVCIDLFTDIYLGKWYDTVVLSPDQVVGKNAQQASWLVDNAVPPIALPHPVIEKVDSPQKGAGLQLAIWDIVHDGGDGFASGRVQAATAANSSTPTDPDVLGWAIYYEKASFGQVSDLAYIYDNYVLGTKTPAQMLIGPGTYHDDGPDPSPEPPTFVLGMGVLLIGIGKFVRPRLRNRGTA